MAAQLSMFMYIILFAAAIRLRYSQANVSRPFKIPFGNIGMWINSSLGILTCATVILIGFIPPIGKIDVGDGALYQYMLLAGLFFFIIPIFLIHKSKRNGRITSVVLWSTSAPIL